MSRWIRRKGSGLQVSRPEISHIVFLEVLVGSVEVGPPLCLKTLERIQSRAWRGQGRDPVLGRTP